MLCALLNVGIKSFWYTNFICIFTLDLLGLEKETLQHQVRAHAEKGDKVSIDIAVGKLDR